MARNKSKAQKQNDVFKVANNKAISKAKGKAKPVTTNLKKVNIVNREKVAKINKAFTEVQKEVKNLSKDIPKVSKKAVQVFNLCLEMF
ncbi:ribosomal biogenesis factor isoform X2 [Callorhinchus milii]|uniref:ribosomal biogenesis factor isoform X2 n=1 Tax=Callorhinchus milii TaxID=7868 RepID=UPI0004574982|nr:ribosomal biogenesis factor isoform X2 [Callorhinchus milii]|eukprot:gi/632970057/ref/XP_007901429.1/ PREDICTED: uncharacterized protein C8orf59 homolog isoform X2 [Callorhinchus milii]